MLRIEPGATGYEARTLFIVLCIPTTSCWCLSRPLERKNHKFCLSCFMLQFFYFVPVRSDWNSISFATGSWWWVSLTQHQDCELTGTCYGTLGREVAYQSGDSRFESHHLWIFLWKTHLSNVKKIQKRKILVAGNGLSLEKMDRKSLVTVIL